MAVIRTNLSGLSTAMTSFLNVIRIFYEVGPPVYEEIGTLFVYYIILFHDLEDALVLSLFIFGPA